MAEYRGYRTPDGCTVFRGDEPLPLAPGLAVRNHSPDGWNWGYHGSGPAQLALALLLEVCSPPLAEALHQVFKRDVIARWKMDEWTFDTCEIIDWITARPDLTRPR